MNAHDVEQGQPVFLGEELRDRILAVLPDECYVTRSAGVRCTGFIDGTFSSGATWTRDMCCLPCRIRAEVDALYSPVQRTSGGAA